MNIGDRVRSIHGKEEGTIRRFIDNRTVEVEIEDGFLIPFLKNDLVSISRQENEHFDHPEPKTCVKQEKAGDKTRPDESGIFLAIRNEEGQITSWLLNLTDHIILFTIHEQESHGLRGIAYGSIKEYAYTEIDHQRHYNGKWPNLVVDVLVFLENGEEFVSPFSKTIKVNKVLSGQKAVNIPWTGKKGYLISLMEDNPVIDPEEIRRSFFSHGDETMPARFVKEQTEDVIDLHIESLVKDASKLNHAEILDLQIAHFEKKLDQAVISGQNVITFIHGIGNGKLRHMIHKKLSKYPHIKFFEDAQKEKFGYGATKVFFK